jgi:hypothetical protein
MSTLICTQHTSLLQTRMLNSSHGSTTTVTGIQKMSQSNISYEDSSLLGCDPTYVFFWDFTQRRMVVSYRCFGMIYQSHVQGSSSYFFLDCLTLEDGTHRVSRNVDKKLPFYAELNPKKAHVSFTSW